MLNLENAFRRVLVTPHSLLQRIIFLRKFAVYVFQCHKRLHCKRPILVPHGELAHEHKRKGISRTIMRNLRCPDLEAVLLGEIRKSIVLKVIIEVLADIPRVCAWKFADFLQCLVIGDHILVERDTVERAGKHVVVHCTEHSGFRHQRHLFLFVKFRCENAFDALIGSHHTEISLTPYSRSELRLGRSDVQTGVHSGGTGIPDVTAGLCHEHEVGLIDGGKRGIYTIQR